MNNYISNGEIRVGFYGSAVGTRVIRIDTLYIMIGSVNDDNSRCEVSFGTGTASNCVNARNIDSTLAIANYST